MQLGFWDQTLLKVVGITVVVVSFKPFASVSWNLFCSFRLDQNLPKKETVWIKPTQKRNCMVRDVNTNFIHNDKNMMRATQSNYNFLVQYVSESNPLILDFGSNLEYLWSIVYCMLCSRIPGLVRSPISMDTLFVYIDNDKFSLILKFLFQCKFEGRSSKTMIEPRAVLLSPHAQYCPFKIDHIVYSDRNSGEFRSGFPCDTDQHSGTRISPLPHPTD